MSGKHAAPGQGEFYLGLAFFVLRWAMGGLALMLIFWVLIVWIPELFPSDEGAGVAPVSVATPDSRVPTTVVATTTSSLPERTTTVPATATTVDPSSSSSSTTTTSSSTSTISSTTTTPAAELLAPSEISVRVMNSTGRSGLAARVTSELAALGYQMLEQGNTGALSTTTVYYVAGLAGEAEVLASELPGAVSVQVNPAGDPSADLLVVLGASYP